MAAPEVKILVCICTYDRYDVLPTAIESVARQSLKADEYDILVVDNSPDHDRAAAFGRQFAHIPNLTYLVEETPGLSNARNVAARQSRAGIVAFIDDDAVATHDWAAQLLAAFEMFGPQAQIVGGRVDPLWAAPRPDWLHDDLLGALSVVNWGGETRVARPEEWAAGANIAFRTRAILDNGGFARNLGRIGSGAVLMSNEEFHLVDCIRAEGGLVLYAPHARVAHLVDPKRLNRAWFRKRLAWQALSDFLMAPDTAVKEAHNSWPNIVNFFNAQPPLERTVRGLARDIDDPDMFHWQTKTIYDLAKLMLAGFEGVELD